MSDPVNMPIRVYFGSTPPEQLKFSDLMLVQDPDKPSQTLAFIVDAAGALIPAHVDEAGADSPFVNAVLHGDAVYNEMTPDQRKFADVTLSNGIDIGFEFAVTCINIVAAKVGADPDLITQITSSIAENKEDMITFFLDKLQDEMATARDRPKPALRIVPTDGGDDV